MKNLLHSVFYLFFAAGVLLCCNANATNRYVVVGSVSGTSGETPTSVKVSTESFAAAEALGSDSYASLTAALAGFADGDVVLVKAGTYYITAQLAPKKSTKMYGGFKDNSATLTTRLTDGNLTGRYDFAAATIIDGGGVTRCLSNAGKQGDTTVDQMVIDGFTFQNGKGPDDGSGGGVWIGYKTKLVRCKVINNVSTCQFGGGVCTVAANSSNANASLYFPTIDSCLVSNNSVVPETSYTLLGGGGIYAVSKSVINNTDIVNNHIEYSAKINGTFQIFGGGVLFTGYTTYFTCFLHEMDNCNISGNSINASNATTETGTTCTAGAYGGGISSYGRSGITMRNSVVQDNTVTAYADTREALFENATLSVVSYGGGIFLHSMASTSKGWAYTLENVRVLDNTCTTSYSRLSGSASVTRYGGGVYCASGLTMTGCEVSGNQLVGTYRSAGGGLYVTVQKANRNINISNSSFCNNSIKPSALGRGQGGGLYVSNSYGSTVLTNLTVENNSISRTTSVSHNKQNVAGGGLYCTILDTVPAVQVIGGSYSGNTITGSTATSVVGGGICSLQDIILKNVKIQRNRLVGNYLDGAGFYHTGSVATLEDCVIGGDTYADGNSAGGTAIYGAGIMVYLGQIEMSNTKVRFNHGTGTASSSYGGGVYVSPNLVSYCDSKLTDCVISDNALYTGAYAYGGGMHITGYKLTLKNTVFERDTLSAVNECYGGGLIASGSVTADNCDFNANVLVKGKETRGAGVYSGTTRVVVKDIPYYFNEQTYTNCRVKDNRMENKFTKARSGGGMCLFSNRMFSESVTSRISVLDSEIAGNKILTTTTKVYSCGGGICAVAYYPFSFNPEYTDSISYINVERCMFRDNEISAYSSGYSYGSAFSMMYNTDAANKVRFGPVYTFNNNLVFNNSGSNIAVFISPKSVCNNTLFNNKAFDKSATTGYMYLCAYKPGTAPWASSIVANNIVWGPTGASIGGTAGQTNLPVKNNYVTGNLPDAAVFAASGNINTSVTAAAAFRSTDMSEYHYDDEEELLVPAPGSPFVGAGYDDTGVTDSYFGDVRPKHGTPAHYDIGALPFMPGAMLTVKTNNAYGTVDVRNKANSSLGTAAYGSDYEEDISPIKSRTLTASIKNPNEGYYFGGWDDGKTDNPRRISFTKESEYTALFKPVCDTVVVSYKDTVADGSYASVDVKVKGTETVRHTFHFSASEVRDAYKTKTGADYPSDGVFRFDGSMGYVAPVYVVKEITIKNSLNVDSVARVALCVAPAYHCDETKSPKDTVYNAVYDYHGVKNHGSWTGLDGENKKDWDISATLPSSLGADSTYTSTVVLKMEESGDEAMYIISWSRDLLKRTVNLRLSLWGQDLNAADGYGYGAKFYLNGSEEITEFTDNKDRTVTLLIPESEIKAGQKMLKITLRDAGADGMPVRSVRYYDVPVMYPRATSDKVALSADVDMWVYGATTVTSTVTVRNVYINGDASLSVSSNSTLTVSGSLYIRCGADGSAGKVAVGSGSKIALPTTAGAVKLVRIVDNKQWYMMSLPYDCDFADIRKSPEVGGNTLPTNQDTYGSKKGPELLIKQYSAVRRAETYQTEEDAKAHNRWWWAGTRENPGPHSHIWDTVATDATIPACHGFEITTNTPYYREIIFSSKELTNGRMQYQTATSIPVKYYNDDQQTWNIHYGWNLIGLPSFQAKSALKTISLDDASDPEKNNWGVYVFNATNRVWNDYDGHTITMSPFQAYLVQIRDDDETNGADHSIILNGAGGNYAKTVLSAPQATRTAQTEPLTFSLLLGEDTLYDRTTFHIHDKYSTDYEIGYDRLKLLSGDALAPQFFSLAPKGEMSHNALPVEAAGQPIQLGYTLPEPGNSTITLFGIKDTEADAIWLHDRQENVTVNLFDGPYEFYSSVTSDYTRFTLNVQPLNSPDDYQHSGEATGVDEPQGTSLSALSSKADGVYDVLGRKVAELPALSADRQATDLLPTGVYVIVKNGEARKEVIR